MGTNNRLALKKLLNGETSHFKHLGNIIHIVYDPPHLLKNIRNNLKKSGFN